MVRKEHVACADLKILLGTVPMLIFGERVTKQPSFMLGATWVSISTARSLSLLKGGLSLAIIRSQHREPVALRRHGVLRRKNWCSPDSLLTASEPTAG